MNEREELALRFWSRVNKSDEASCWDWAGSVTVYGYGQFQAARGKSYRAHRLAYELSVGPIPSDKVLDHLCRNRQCVNPAHLEAVTSRTNVLRGVGPTAQNAAKEMCGKGHPFDSTGSKGERLCRKCANIKTGTWAIAKRRAIVCGAPTRDGESCKLKIAAGKRCRNHGTTNPATVLHEPEATK